MVEKAGNEILPILIEENKKIAANYKEISLSHDSLEYKSVINQLNWNITCLNLCLEHKGFVRNINLSFTKLGLDTTSFLKPKMSYDKVNFDSVEFYGADLGYVIFNQCSFSNVVFDYSTLTNAHFISTIFEKCSLNNFMWFSNSAPLWSWCDLAITNFSPTCINNKRAYFFEYCKWKIDSVDAPNKNCFPYKLIDSSYANSHSSPK